MAQQPTYADSDRPTEAPQWVCDREGLPVSPGIAHGPAPARPPLTWRQEWFKDLKFGMFIPWGLDSILADDAASEAAFRDINWEAPSLGDRLARLGEEFDAQAWVDLAQRAGQQYLAF